VSSGSQPSSISYSSTMPGGRTSTASGNSARRVCRCSLRWNSSEGNAAQEKVSPEQFTMLAEAELSAFHQTMSRQFGDAFAEDATEHWFRAFAGAEIDPADPQRSLRRVTIKAITSSVVRTSASNAAAGE